METPIKNGRQRKAAMFEFSSLSVNINCNIFLAINSTIGSKKLFEKKLFIVLKFIEL